MYYFLKYACRLPTVQCIVLKTVSLNYDEKGSITPYFAMLKFMFKHKKLRSVKFTNCGIVKSGFGFDIRRHYRILIKPGVVIFIL